MIVRAISNRAIDVPVALRDMAYPEGANSSDLDITPGMHYAVYAVREDGERTDYFVHTDTQNIDSLWWMPSELYELIDPASPQGWIKEDGNDPDLYAYPSLFDGKIHDDIIDGEDEAIEQYLSEVGADPTFPSQSQIDDLNKPFEADKKREEYEKAKLLAKERGYEWPTKPLDNE